MAEIKPFRALRYDERRAGPLEDVIAPPYDVIGPEERKGYLAKSPHNVVHLTLPESEAEAGRLYRTWRDEGVLVADEAGFWALSQEYRGPDGIARTRTGLVASLKVEPYETGTVLPHERTHRGPKEGRSTSRIERPTSRSRALDFGASTSRRRSPRPSPTASC